MADACWFFDDKFQNCSGYSTLHEVIRGMFVELSWLWPLIGQDLPLLASDWGILIFEYHHDIWTQWVNVTMPVPMCPICVRSRNTCQLFVQSSFNLFLNCLVDWKIKNKNVLQNVKVWILNSATAWQHTYVCTQFVSLSNRACSDVTSLISNSLRHLFVHSPSIIHTKHKQDCS